MKTIVYVDGYNLYFSRLKYTSYKWLDLYTFFQRQILHPQNPASDLLCVKYYTADIKAKFASQGAAAGQAQQCYHRALESVHTGPVEITKGYYTDSRATPMRYKHPPDKTDKVEAWKLEEKQTDVNLALDVYRDTIRQQVTQCVSCCVIGLDVYRDTIRQQAEQLVICTNDTDIVPALRRVREDMPGVTLGLVFPHRPNEQHRRPASDLQALAHWVRHHIRDEELAAAQFPLRVPTRKKPVDKPHYW